MKELQVRKNNRGAVKTIPSYEVAKMMERPHWKVLNMIEGKAGEVGITKVLTDNDFVVSEYFIESTYRDKSGKTNKCPNQTQPMFYEGKFHELLKLLDV